MRGYAGAAGGIKTPREYFRRAAQSYPGGTEYAQGAPPGGTLPPRGGETSPGLNRAGEMKRALQEVGVVVGQFKAVGHPEFAGTIGKFMPERGACGISPRAEGRPVILHERDSLERIDGAQKHGAGDPGFLRDHIQQGIHMALVDIGPSGRPEHGGISPAESPAGMAAGIMAAGIRFCFHYQSGNPAAGRVMDEEHADKVPGHLQGMAPEERGGDSVMHKSGQGNNR